MEWLFRLIDRLSGKQALRQLEFNRLLAEIRAEELKHQREFLRILKRDLVTDEKPKP